MILGAAGHDTAILQNVFRALPDCSRVPIYRNSDGGMKVRLSVRARCLGFDSLTADLLVTDASGSPLSSPQHFNSWLDEDRFRLDPLDPSTLAVDSSAPDSRALQCADGGFDQDGGATVSSAVTPVPGDVDGWGEREFVLWIPEAGSGDAVLPSPAYDGHPVRIELRLTDTTGRTAGDVRMPVLMYCPVPPCQ